MATTTERNYEAMVIINSLMTEDQINAIIERLAGVLTTGGAVIKETSRWGRRKLAYEINKRSEGFYVIYYFTLEANAELLQSFERACRYDENVLRYMVINVPTRKRGQDVAQIIPTPGWIADFNFAPRPPRRRPDYDRQGPPQQYQGPSQSAAPAAAEAPVAEAAASEAPAEA